MVKCGVRKLPPLPPTPKRPLPAPERSGPVIEVRAWEDEESSTGRSNLAISTYQSLLSVFDGLTPEERLEFVELAAVWAGMKAAERRVLMDLLGRR